MADEHALKLLGRYAVCDEIGSGGMATVHIGRLLGPVGFSRTVAIKRMHPHLSADPEFVTMFLDEARIAASVQHANVVSTLDVVTEAGELFLVMEYVEGESFARVLRTVGRKGVRLPLPIVGAIVSQALYGLHAVHEAKEENGRALGLIHRDVSPDNVIIGRDGTARVLDFGIAKATEHGRRTQAGKIKGKVAYMAPEQMRAKDLDRRVDIYAAGAMLWEALTGERLLKGTNDVEMIHHALANPPQPPSTLVPSLSPALDAVVMKALAKEKEARFATAREMAIGVERALGVASPATVGQLIEGMMGASLAKRAALVEQAVRRTNALKLGEGNASRGSVSELSPAPSTPMPRELRLDAENVLVSVAESPRALLGPPSSGAIAQPRVEPPPAASGPFAPVDAPPHPGPQVIAGTRAYGSGGEMPFSELLASGGASGANAAAEVAANTLSPTGADRPRGELTRAGTELMAGNVAIADRHAPSGTVLLPDLPALGSSNATQPSAGVAPRAPAPLPKTSEPNAMPHFPSLELGPAQIASAAPAALPRAPSAAPQARPAEARATNDAARAASTGPANLDVDFGRSATRDFVPAPIRADPGAAPRYAVQPYHAEAKPSARLGVLIIPIGVAALIAVAGAGVYLATRTSATAPAPSSRPPQSADATKACETFRKRVYEGNHGTGLSRDGWVAELWLRAAQGSTLDSSKVDVEALRGADRASGGAVDKLTAPGRGFDEGLIVRLWGPVVEKAFDTGGAEPLIKAADLAFEHSNAKAGALYLKCSHMPYHDVGIWFRGADITVAASSVLFAMGVYAEKPVIRDGALDGPEHSAAATVFDRIERKVQRGKTAELDLEMQRYGATVEPMAERGGVRVVFPAERLPDAVRLSRVIADRAGIENL